MQLIFKTCDNSILEIYTKNLDKNLFELDNMAAQKAPNEYREAFQNFEKQGLTNVRKADKYALLLKKNYTDKLNKIKSELEKTKADYAELLDKKNDEAKKVVEEYKEVLWKREKFRMEAYKFNWTNTGWIKIDTGIVPKTWGPQPLSVFIENGNEFDRVYTYVIYSTIKSLYRLNEATKTEFYVGNKDEKKMLMPKNKLAVVIAIGYKGETLSMANFQIETGSSPIIKVKLEETTLAKFK